MDYESIYQNCLDYFNGDTLATSTFINKYLLRDRDGNFKESDPRACLKERIVPEYFRIEQNYPNSLDFDEIYESLEDFKYIIPSGSPLFGIGNSYQYSSLSNCFMIGQPYDSYGGIMKKDEHLAQIQKRRGGVGIDASSIRPRTSSVQNSALTSDGVSSFMGRWSNTTNEVAQGGRRGALLISLDCRHPDILDFIKSKQDLESISGANISVKWRDDFLKAVKNDGKYKLKFPVDAKIEEAQIVKEINARDVWDEFCKQSWRSGDPGCLFWDRMLNQSISDIYIPTSGVNPCGELPLHEYGSCILMSLNLTSFVNNPFKSDSNFDWDLFENKTRIAIRLIDDLVDLELERVHNIIQKIKNDPEPNDIKYEELNLWKRIYESQKKYRKVGLGTTGLGDMLAMLGLKYGSKKSIKFVDELYSNFHKDSYLESANLAKERGPFEDWDWDKEKDNHYIKILNKDIQDKIKENGRRNISCLTMAPTGSISMIVQTTSGIEPVYQLKYKRNRKMTGQDEKNGIKSNSVDKNGVKWIEYEVEHKGIKKWREVTGETDESKSPYFDCDAHSLNWNDRIDMQSTIQKYIDGSISSTINLPQKTQQEDMDNIFMEAWKKNLKGITVFRHGCKKGILSSESDDLEDDRPEVLPCEIHYSNIKCKQTGQLHKWIFLVGFENGVVREVFGGHRKSIEIPSKYTKGWIVKKKSNHYNLVLGSLDDENERFVIHDIAKTFEPDPGSYTRLISLCLQKKIPLNLICDKLLKDSEADLYSFEKGLSRVLRKFIKDGEKMGIICPSCQTKSLVIQDGCMYCTSCGASLCD